MKEYVVMVTGLVPDEIYECAVEEIIRCRDCKYCGMDETRYAGLGCMKFSFGSCHKDIPFGDGYCAWGKRLDD